MTAKSGQQPKAAYYRTFSRKRSQPQQRFDKHVERIRAEKRREYKGAFGLSVFLVIIIFASILTTDKINYKLTNSVFSIKDEQKNK